MVTEIIKPDLKPLIGTLEPITGIWGSTAVPQTGTSVTTGPGTAEPATGILGSTVVPQTGTPVTTGSGTAEPMTGVWGSTPKPEIFTPPTIPQGLPLLPPIVYRKYTKLQYCKSSAQNYRMFCNGA